MNERNIVSKRKGEKSFGNPHRHFPENAGEKAGNAPRSKHKAPVMGLPA